MAGTIYRESRTVSLPSLWCTARLEHGEQVVKLTVADMHWVEIALRAVLLAALPACASLDASDTASAVETTDTTVAQPDADDPASALADAFDRLTAAQRALDRARADYRDAAQNQTLDPREAEDFQGFIRALDRQVQSACTSVSTLGGDLGAHTAYCTPAAMVQNTAIPPSAYTRDEQLAAIDAELNSAIGTFDDLLLREQKILDQQAQNSGGGSGAGGGGAGSGNSGAGGSRGGSAASGGNAGAGGQGGQSGQGAVSGGGMPGDMDADSDGQNPQIQGPPAPAAGSPGAPSGNNTPPDIPKDIPDGQDDNVVARQLREAAMKEKDPELRARLWEEYRRYKKSIGGTASAPVEENSQ